MRHHARILVSLLMLALFGSTASLAAAPTQLTVQGGSSVPNVVYLPIYVADQAGFFKDEGLAVDLRYTQGGSLATQLVANGNADIAHIVWQPALQVAARGGEGRFFYQTYTRCSFFLATLPSSSLKNAGDLAGKTIGVVNMASPGIFLAKSMARAAGISPDKITFVPVGVGAQALVALSTGKVDGLSLWDAEYANYEAAGQQLAYIHHPRLGNIGNGGFYASEKALKGKREALEGFSRAIAKATAFMLAHPEEALRMYWKVAPSGRPQGTDDEAIKKGLIAVKFVSHSFDVTGRPDHRFGAMNLDDVQAFIDALHTEGEIPAAVPAKDVVDTSFTDAANKFDLDAARARKVN